MDTGSQRAKDWMAEFEISGGLLDGILAVTHPRLYAAAIEVAEKLCVAHGSARVLMQEWPSCFSTIEVIVNRETPRHRNIGTLLGCLDLLLPLGTYGENGVLELRNLGVCLPYDSGSVTLLNSKIVLHAVPKVPGDLVCYACHMNKDIFKWMKVPMPGMSHLSTSQHGLVPFRDHEEGKDGDEVDLQKGGSVRDDDEDAEGSFEAAE